MKMQIITITPKEPGIDAGFTVSRNLYDDCVLVDAAYCSIEAFPHCKSGFVASGFSSIHKPNIIHDMNNAKESIDDFVKAVFAQ